ncbi:hypothetical protein FSOLCH5_000599 [Fusarium solani]|nr:hypothetical protein NW759_005736 [Fusarium solani]
MSLPSRVLLSSSSRALAARSFHTSARRMADAAPLPARKPMGAFRGGLFGFLLGSFLSGSAAYSYLLKEYKTANDLLTEDIYVRNQRDEAIDKQRPRFNPVRPCDPEADPTITDPPGLRHPPQQLRPGPGDKDAGQEVMD